MFVRKCPLFVLKIRKQGTFFYLNCKKTWRSKFLSLILCSKKILKTSKIYLPIAYHYTRSNF
jgi:hypothetical protein